MRSIRVRVRKLLFHRDKDLRLGYVVSDQVTDKLSRTVSVPTWVCAGEHDAGPMAFNKTCESAIPNCTRTVISGCGHFPMVDAADSFISQFEAFVDASA